ncbi:hypothetical protein Hanom_Chr05g00442061 [Helianthus anomalus]
MVRWRLVVVWNDVNILCVEFLLEPLWFDFGYLHPLESSDVE